MSRHIVWHRNKSAAVRVRPPKHRLLNGLLALVFASQMSACSKGEPIQLSDQRYFGTWVYKQNPFGNNVRIDNRLLAIYEDSTITYIRCSKQANNSTSVSLPSGYISKLTETELTVEADVLVTTVKMRFKIEQPPVQRDGDWFMRMDGVDFRKLHQGEASDHESWPCRDDERE